MANGPLGGFMPTPPSPGQPPQVKLETSAESRGNFNKFLGTLPKNGATTTIQTGVMQSSMPPVSPMTSNVNIFNPQMSQMTAMPMMPPAQPVQNFFFGGAAMSGGAFSDADIGSQIDSFDDGSDNNEESIVGDDPDAGFDFNEDTGRFDVADRPDVTGDEQEQNIQDAQTFIDTPLSAPPVDTRPRTNIRNVGARSNLRFDPQFTANLLQQRGLDPEGLMSPADFQQTTQGGGTGAAPTLSSALPSFGTGTGPLVREQLDRLRPGAGVSPVAQTAQGQRVSPTQLDFGLGLALDDPLGLGRTTAGVIEGARAVQRMRGPEQFVQMAGLPSVAQTVVPGAGSLPSIDTVADDLVAGQGKGANINNPGNIRAGAGFDGEIGRTRDGFAIFDNLQSGVNAINTLTNTYGSKRNVDTVREYANRYSPVGENTPKEVAGKIDVLSNALGVGPDDKVDFTDPAVQARLTPAVMTTEIGAGKTADVLNTLQRGTDASILGNLNLQQLGTNVPVTSDVNQLGTLDPIGQTTQRKTFVQSQPEGALKGTGFDFVPDAFQISNFLSQRGTAPTLTTGITGTAPVGTQTAGSRGDIVRPNVPISRGMQDLTREDEQLIAPEILGTGRIGGVTEETFRSLPEDVQQRIVSNLGDVGTPITNIDPEPNRGIVPDTALETLADRIGPRDTVFDIDTSLPGQQLPVDTVFDIDTRSPGQQPTVDTVFDIDTRPRGPVDTVFDIDTTTRSPTTNLIQGPQQSIVGDDEAFAELNIGDIQGDVTQERVADILNRPDRFKETFKIGDVEFPNLIATLANKVGTMFDRRLFDAIVSKGLDAVVDPDTGRIIGAKNELGQLIEGRDLDQFQPDDGGDDPVTKFLKRATEKEDDEEDEKPPNVIGGGTPADPKPRPPTVVKSTAPASTASFTPVGFDAGNLNQLIARITGVPSPRRMQEGGTVAAVDRFLSSVA